MLSEQLDALLSWWPHLAAVANLGLALVVSGHVVLHKKYARSAVGWVALVWFAPFVGSLLYLILGINRIQRKAHKLGLSEPAGPEGPTEALAGDSCGHMVADLGSLSTLARLVGEVSHQPLTEGNAVEILGNGTKSYPAMLDAIGGAERSVALLTYIFDRDPVGADFVEALIAAHQRGVEVRVLVDGVGAWYSRPPVTWKLKAAGVPAALFLFDWNLARMPFINLRNHRKLLVVDGHVAITGGMNIRHAHALDRSPKTPTEDLMVRVRGPVVAQLFEVFHEDWAFTTGETLRGPAWHLQGGSEGKVFARAMPDGPDEAADRAWRTVLGALAVAQHRVAIVTPYFLPEEELETALETAALRGVEVELFLPEASNLPFLDMASRAELPTLVAEGVVVWRVPAPFDHTKLMVVDDAWVMLGSTNWDSRSFRLNFELNLECYDPELTARFWEQIDARRIRGRVHSAAELAARPMWKRLLDGTLRLWKPYL